MDSLTSTAASGMRSRIESLDLLANNIANSDTAGYKADEESYNLYFGDNAWDGYNNGRPATSEMPLVEKSWTNHSQGTLINTGNPNDFALGSKGFFVVQSSSGPLYTRNGHFTMTKSGRLETAEGYTVTDKAGQPVQLDRTKPFEVRPSGDILQNGKLVTTLQVVDTQDLNKLSKHGASYFRIANDVTPQPVANPDVAQGRVEGSNVQAAQASVKLVGVMRQFEMLQKAVQLAGEMNKRTFDEIARVNG